MSQRPKAGAQARPASAARVAPTDVVMNADPAKVEPEAEVELAADVESVSAAPVEVEIPSEVEPIITAESAVEAVLGAEPEPVAEIAAVVEVSVPEPVQETIAATSDLAAASANVVSTSITTAADTVAAVTTEVVEIAASISPTEPNLTPPRNLSQGMKTMMKSTEDFVAFGQANLEAFVKSGQIWSAGMQELTKQFASSAKASFEESVSTFKAITTAKSVKEAMELQSTFAKAALEKAMAESNKMTDASIKLTEQTLAPITARVTVAVETFGKAA